MTSLLAGLPSKFLRQNIERQLIPGCVIRIEVNFEQITKPKFLVLVATDNPDYLSFFINSEINEFIKHRPDLIKCQVSIDCANHGFLDYDSHIACHNVYSIKKEDIIKKLLQDTTAIKGEISKSVKDEILAAVKHAKTIDNHKKSRIIQGLSTVNS